MMAQESCLPKSGEHAKHQPGYRIRVPAGSDTSVILTLFLLIRLHRMLSPLRSLSCWGALLMTTHRLGRYHNISMLSGFPGVPRQLLRSTSLLTYSATNCVPACPVDLPTGSWALTGR